MTVKEFATISMAIKAAYPHANLMPDDKSKDVWYTMLSDLDYTVCLSAIKEIISNNTFAPSIAEIRAKCAVYTQIPIMDYGEAWGTVLKAIRKYGYMEEVSALESLDEITRKCVQRLGFQNICHDEDESATRANFRMIYEQEANRTKQSNQLPAQLQVQKQQMIEQIVSNLAPMIQKKEEPEREYKTADMDHVSALLDGLRRN